MILFKLMTQKTTQKWISLGILTTFFIGNGLMLFNNQSFKTNDPSWQERLKQAEISKAMFIKNPLGVGINNFTLEMEQANETKLKPWEFQPVHNVYWLILNETGIQGLLLLLSTIMLMLWKYGNSEQNITAMGLLIIASFDHFLGDSFVGIMLIAIVLGFYFKSPKSLH